MKSDVYYNIIGWNTLFQYEILSLNPPLPDPPRTPVRVRKKIIADKRRRLEKLKKEERMRKLMGEDDSDLDVRVLPSMDALVKSYLRRHEERMKSGISPSQSRREEEYYNNLLLGRHAANARDGGGGGGRGRPRRRCTRPWDGRARSSRTPTRSRFGSSRS